MTRGRRLLLATVLDLVLFGGEAVASGLSHSAGLLADAGHNLADAASLAVALFAVVLVRRAPTSKRSFGFHRATILSALLSAAFLLITTTFVAIVGINRLMHPVAEHGATIAITGGIAAVLNGLAAYVVAERSSDLNMRGAFLHLAGDALSSLGVCLVGVIEVLTGRFVVLDAIVSLLIAALIGYEAVQLGRSCIDVLLESSPKDVDLTELARAIGEIPGVQSLHDVHVWSLSSEVRALSAHLVLAGLPSLEDAQHTAQHVRDAVSERFSIAHSTLELESEPCEEGAPIICSIRAITTAPLGERRERGMR